MPPVKPDAPAEDERPAPLAAGRLEPPVAGDEAVDLEVQDPALPTGPEDDEAGEGEAPSMVEKIVKKADDTLLSAKLLDDEAIKAFRDSTGYGLMRGDGGFTLTDPSGRALFELPEEEAAELARIWTPEVARRVAAMGVLWREDLSPAERRRLIEAEIYQGIPGPHGDGSPAEFDWTSMEGGDPEDFRRRAAAAKLKAYDALAAALKRGASNDEIGELIEDFQAAMLPEVFGTGRFVRELLMDVVPGLGNVRSVRHLQNDIAAVERAIESGEWGDAAMASGMAVLDAIGILPGGNLLKAGGRRLAKAVPHLDGLLAERTIRRLRAQWANKSIPAINVRDIFGSVFDQFPSKVQQRLRGLINDRVGKAGGETLLENLGRKMDPDATTPASKDLPSEQGFPSKTREYDLEARYRSHILEEKNATLGRLARWLANAGNEAITGAKAEAKQFELKVGEKSKPPREELPDEYFRSNPDIAREHKVNEIVDLRMDPREVPIDFVINDLQTHLDKWVKKGKLPRDEAELLMLAMRQMKTNGSKGMPVENYATLLVRFGASQFRDASLDEAGFMGMPTGMS